MIGKNQKLKRALLWLPARAYELAVRLRIVAYETGYLKQKTTRAAIISVGNITVGGVGKTPLVDFVARYLKSEDRRVAILTRGYGRKAQGIRVLNDPLRIVSDPSFREFGDEPLMLARRLPDVPVIVDQDRYQAARKAEQELDAEVLILDDGYQHLRLNRDLNILLIDATDPFGGFEMAPFGRLREPLYGIKRADLVIITRADRPFDQSQTLSILKYFCGEHTPLIYVYFSIGGLRHLASGEVYEMPGFAGWNVELMCGIGNPEAFAEDVLQAGMNIVGEHFFRDHHAFKQEELNRVVQAAQQTAANAIITTEKDAVRLEGLDLPDFPVYAAQLTVESEDDVRLKSLLLRALIEAERKKRARSQQPDESASA